jgi:hypothetical protein
MALVSVAYTHTVHYLVETEDDTIESVAMPGWMNVYSDPDIVWYEETGEQISLADPLAEKAIEILETQIMPTNLEWQ